MNQKELRQLFLESKTKRRIYKNDFTNWNKHKFSTKNSEKGIKNSKTKSPLVSGALKLQERTSKFCKLRIES